MDVGGFSIRFLSGQVFVWHAERFGGKSFRQEHDLILVVVPFGLVIDMSGQGIWLGRMSTGSMGEGVVKSGQIEGPPGLTAVQRLGHSEIHEVSVVIQDLDCVFSPFQYVSPLLKSAYDCYIP